MQRGGMQRHDAMRSAHDCDFHLDPPTAKRCRWLTSQAFPVSAYSPTTRTGLQGFQVCCLPSVAVVAAAHRQGCLLVRPSSLA